jgi:hypothetical protein
MLRRIDFRTVRCLWASRMGYQPSRIAQLSADHEKIMSRRPLVSRPSGSVCLRWFRGPCSPTFLEHLAAPPGSWVSSASLHVGASSRSDARQTAQQWREAGQPERYLL